jgi:copper resistance protein C
MTGGDSGGRGTGAPPDSERLSVLIASALLPIIINCSPPLDGCIEARGRLIQRQSALRWRNLPGGKGMDDAAAGDFGLRRSARSTIKAPMQPLLARWPAAALLPILAVLGPPPAFAHAVILAATPAPDAVIEARETPVTLRFNSRIDRERSRLSLLRPDRSSTTLPLDDRTGPDTLAAHLTGLSPGHYRLRWQVLGIDGHITRGDIPFEIVP